MTYNKEEVEMLEVMFNKMLDVLIVVLLLEVAILGMKLKQEKSTKWDVPTPPELKRCGISSEVLVEGGTSPKLPPLEDESSPCDLWFTGSSEGEGDFYIPILNPAPKRREAIRRVVINGV